MNNSQIATAVAIRDLNCYSLETIDDRILLQKKIYLAQDIGLPLGYGYSWYIHGPYSPDLTAAAYQIIPEEITAIENHSFREPYGSRPAQHHRRHEMTAFCFAVGKAICGKSS